MGADFGGSPETVRTVDRRLEGKRRHRPDSWNAHEARAQLVVLHRHSLILALSRGQTQHDEGHAAVAKCAKKAFRMKTETTDFWNKRFSVAGESPEAQRHKRAVVERACAWLGDIRGKRIVDLGCGAGVSSLVLAEKGAHVVALDVSSEGIKRLERQCALQGLTNVEPLVGDAMKIDQLGPFDCIVGLMILHHIEPFESFVKIMRRNLKRGGRAFFWENNAVPLLMWFRKHIVGRYGVPKHGDADESPLSRKEIDVLRQYFTVHIEFPELYLFRLISTYLLHNKFKSSFHRIDEIGGRISKLRHWSYRQYIMIE
jgi:2-polyprenyl-3-methyl-5-hydroxy-6-metoxy-1,4-benzoquinol methylase